MSLQAYLRLSYPTMHSSKYNANVKRNSIEVREIIFYESLTDWNGKLLERFILSYITLWEVQTYKWLFIFYVAKSKFISLFWTYLTASDIILNISSRKSRKS